MNDFWRAMNDLINKAMTYEMALDEIDEECKNEVLNLISEANEVYRFINGVEFIKFVTGSRSVMGSKSLLDSAVDSALIDSIDDMYIY